MRDEDYVCPWCGAQKVVPSLLDDHKTTCTMRPMEDS